MRLSFLHREVSTGTHVGRLYIHPAAPAVCRQRETWEGRPPRDSGPASLPPERRGQPYTASWLKSNCSSFCLFSSLCLGFLCTDARCESLPAECAKRSKTFRFLLNDATLFRSSRRFKYHPTQPQQSTHVTDQPTQEKPNVFASVPPLEDFPAALIRRLQTGISEDRIGRKKKKRERGRRRRSQQPQVLSEGAVTCVFGLSSAAFKSGVPRSVDNRRRRHLRCTPAYYSSLSWHYFLLLLSSRTHSIPRRFFELKETKASAVKSR